MAAAPLRSPSKRSAGGKFKAKELKAGKNFKKQQQEELQARKKDGARSDWASRSAGFGAGDSSVHADLRAVEKQAKWIEKQRREVAGIAEKERRKIQKRLLKERERLVKSAPRSIHNHLSAETTSTFRLGVWEAARCGNIEFLERMANEGRHDQFRSLHPETGGTALHEAAAGGRTDAVKFLLTFSHDIEVRDAQGRTPLFRAAEAPWEDAAVFLVLSGADIHSRDNAGRSCYDMAEKVSSSFADRIKKARGDWLIFQKQEADKARAATAGNPALQVSRPLAGTVTAYETLSRGTSFLTAEKVLAQAKAKKQSEPDFLHPEPTDASYGPGAELESAQPVVASFGPGLLMAAQPFPPMAAQPFPPMAQPFPPLYTSAALQPPGFNPALAGLPSPASPMMMYSPLPVALPPSAVSGTPPIFDPLLLAASQPLPQFAVQPSLLSSSSTAPPTTLPLSPPAVSGASTESADLKETTATLVTVALLSSLAVLGQRALTGDMVRSLLQSIGGQAKKLVQAKEAGHGAFGRPDVASRLESFIGDLRTLLLLVVNATPSDLPLDQAVIVHSHVTALLQSFLMLRLQHDVEQAGSAEPRLDALAGELTAVVGWLKAGSTATADDARTVSERLQCKAIELGLVAQISWLRSGNSITSAQLVAAAELLQQHVRELCAAITAHPPAAPDAATAIRLLLGDLKAIKEWFTTEKPASEAAVMAILSAPAMITAERQQLDWTSGLRTLESSHSSSATSSSASFISSSSALASLSCELRAYLVDLLAAVPSPSVPATTRLLKFTSIAAIVTRFEQQVATTVHSARHDYLDSLLKWTRITCDQIQLVTALELTRSATGVDDSFALRSISALLFHQLCKLLSRFA